MHHPSGHGRRPAQIDSLVAEHGATKVLSALQLSQPEHALPAGHFGQLAQAIVKYGHVDADSPPTLQQESLFSVSEDAKIDTQGRAFSLLGAILDKQVEDFQNGNGGVDSTWEHFAHEELLSPYAMGAYVLLCALGVSNKADSRQSQSLAAFRSRVAEFDFSAHTEALISPKEAARRHRNGINQRNAAYERKEDDERAKLWLERVQSATLGNTLLAVARGQAEIGTSLPGRFIDIANALGDMGVVDRIGAPLARILEELNISTDDPREGILYAAALQDAYLAEALVSDSEHNVRRIAPSQIRVLLLLSTGLTLARGATRLQVSRAHKTYDRLLERAATSALRNEALERAVHPDQFPELALQKLYDSDFMQDVAVRKSNRKKSLDNEIVLTDVVRRLATMVAPDEATAKKVWASLFVQLEHVGLEALLDLQNDLKKLGTLFDVTPEADDQPQANSESSEYLNRERYERLTAEQEVELAFSIEAGVLAQEKLDRAKQRGEILDPELERDLRMLAWNGRRDKERFIKANIPLAKYWANRSKYQHRGLSRSDLIQEGVIGLIRAIEMFDYTAGNKFSTYAFQWVDRVLTSAIQDRGRTIRFPRGIEESLSKMRRVGLHLEQSLNRSPSYEEIAREMNISVAKVTKLKQLEQQGTVSLNMPLGEDLELGDVLSDAKAGHEMAMVDFNLKLDLETAISQLTEREEKIIRARFREEPMSPEQVAKWLGIPGALARQLEWKALRKLAKTSPELRQYLNEKGGNA